jgi:hypothetical protein
MDTYETQSGTEVALKDESVDVEALAPGVLDRVLDAAQPSYEKRGAMDSFVVTSAHDGTHSAGSLHDDGLALDLRTWAFSPAEAKRVTAEIQRRLGDRWDVCYEATHIHVEYDPAP